MTILFDRSAKTFPTDILQTSYEINKPDNIILYRSINSNIIMSIDLDRMLHDSL